MITERAVAFKKFHGLCVALYPDSDCESPMECEEHIHITYRRGSRYILGNEPVDTEELEELMGEPDVVWLPVQAYVHSGVALSASARNPYPDPQWDSGMSGIVYMRKDDIRQRYMRKRISKKTMERALESMRATVEIFGQWCNGECYGYDITDASGESLDSCWGYIGDEWAFEAAKEAIEGMKEHWVPDAPDEEYWDGQYEEPDGEEEE